MSEDQFTKLFKYMSQRFDSVEKRLDNTATKEDFYKIMNILDEHTRRFDDIDLELAAINSHLSRHE